MVYTIASALILLILGLFAFIYDDDSLSQDAETTIGFILLTGAFICFALTGVVQAINNLNLRTKPEPKPRKVG